MRGKSGARPEIGGQKRDISRVRNRNGSGCRGLTSQPTAVLRLLFGFLCQTFVFSPQFALRIYRPPTMAMVAGALEDRTLPFDPMVVITPMQIVTIRASRIAYSTA